MTLAPVQVGTLMLQPVEGKCNAPNPKRGKLCRAVAGAGTEHSGVGPCRVHGGNLPSVRGAWEPAFQQRRAAQSLAKFAQPVVEVDPETALLDLVSEAAGNVAWLGRQVAELVSQDAGEAEAADLRRWARAGGGYKEGRALFGPSIELDRFGTEHVVGEEVRAMVTLYERWSDKLARYSKVALDAGIEKRRVEMAERQGETIVIVLQNVFVQMGLSAEQIATARRLAAQEFRALESGE